MCVCVWRNSPQQKNSSSSSISYRTRRRLLPDNFFSNLHTTQCTWSPSISTSPRFPRKKREEKETYMYVLCHLQYTRRLSHRAPLVDSPPPDRFNLWPHQSCAQQEEIRSNKKGVVVCVVLYYIHVVNLLWLCSAFLLTVLGKITLILLRKNETPCVPCRLCPYCLQL